MDMQEGQPIPKAGWFDKFFFRIAAVDEDTLRLCPHEDWENVRRVAEIMVCVWIYQTTLFSIISHRIFAAPGQFRPELILISSFLATFILLIDSYMVMRSGWYLSGIAELKRGGINVSGGVSARIKASIFLAFRILLSIGIAQLAAIFLGILFFSSDIDPPIQSAYVQSNAALIAAATTQVDDPIKEAKNALDAENSREAALASQVNALRQDRIDPSANRPEIQQANQEIAQLMSERAKADQALQSAETFASDELGGIRGSQDNSGIPGDGPRRRAALEALENARNNSKQVSAALDAARTRIDVLRKDSAPSAEIAKKQSESELPSFEAALVVEERKVQALQNELDRRTEHREDAIRAVVDGSLRHIPAASGILSQIAALEHLARNDPKIGIAIILIDLVSFSFELAAVLVKITSSAPTYYAALLSRNVYMRVVHLVDGMAVELNRGSSEVDPEVDFNVTSTPRGMTGRDRGMPPGSDSFGNSADPSSPEAKRPRGRPPKASFNGKPDRPLPFGDGFPLSDS